MNKNTIKKILILVVLWVLYCPGSTVFANEKWDQILNKIDAYISEKSQADQKRLYIHIWKRLEELALNQDYSKQTLELIEYIQWWLEQTVLSYTQLQQRSLILRFSNDSQDNLKYIESHYQDIEQAEHVFLFRYSQNLSGSVLKEITQGLYQINPQLTLYIDQEGGYINRYKSFDILWFESYLSGEWLSLYNWLTPLTQASIWSLFEWEYFPSPYEIGRSYEQIAANEQEDFLRVIAWVILKNLSDHGIVYHGLVLDLDRGNPVISGLERSFSSDLEDYTVYVDAFLWASEATGVQVYGKHFPGHGAGEVDSHSWILVYGDEDDYISENLELFEYFLNTRPDIKKGVMVGHMYVPESFRDQITSILKKSDFILTDDLAMEWYQQTLSQSARPNSFLTTHILWDLWVEIIIVDTAYNPDIN